MPSRFFENVVHRLGSTKMPLRRHRHFLRPGKPEVGALVLVALSVLSAYFWWRSEVMNRWPTASGSVLACDIQSMHYNATRYGNRVEIEYTYDVDNRPYVGHWIGYWPVTESRNALPSGRTELLKQKGYPLEVMYNPGNPSINRLHDSPAGRRRLYAGATIIAIMISFAYMVFAYPQLRTH